MVVGASCGFGWGPRRRRWLCGGSEVMGLCCYRGGAGRTADVLCSAPGSLQHCGVSGALFLWIYTAPRRVLSNVLLARGL